MTDGHFHIKVDKAWFRKNGATWLAILGFGGTSVFNTLSGKQIEAHVQHDQHDIHTIVTTQTEILRRLSVVENENERQESHIQANRDDVNDNKYDILDNREMLEYGY